MLLYHTSQTEIPVPDIHHGRKNADFGWGFYLTPNQDFAYRWAWNDAVMNRYELNTDHLSVHTFTRKPEWYEYIFHNRHLKDTLCDDVIIGPIANDTIFETLGILTSGYLTSEEALQLFLIGPEYTQVVIKTQKAADQLTWLGSEVITGVEKHKEILEKEKEEYQKQFAETLLKMTG